VTTLMCNPSLQVFNPLQLKASEVADRILEVTPVQVSAVSKYSSANSNNSSESKLLKELETFTTGSERTTTIEKFFSKSFRFSQSRKEPKPKASNYVGIIINFATKAKKCIQPCSSRKT
ncbi:hypothetical protein TNCV_3374171, partial [Trichonephila clavipes]